MEHAKLRVGVITGGRSSEREPSLESGRHVVQSLDKSKYDVMSLYMDPESRLWQIPYKLLVLHRTEDVVARLEQDAKPVRNEELPQLIDFAFFALHGKYAEDGCLQGLLELLKVPYSGSGVLGSALGMDKYAQRLVLRDAGIDTPRTVLIDRPPEGLHAQTDGDHILAELGSPLIIKPRREGCSTGVTKVGQPADLARALEEAWCWDYSALAEEFLDGLEFTCGVLEGGSYSLPTALLPSETVRGYQGGVQNEILTLRDKFLPGAAENITPARVDDRILERIQREVEHAFAVLLCRIYARIDGFVVDDRVVITEVNTLPGLMPATVLYHELAQAGISPAQFFDFVIAASLEAHATKIGPLR